MKLKIAYRGPQNDEGSFFYYEHEAEIADEADATFVGREFARLAAAVGRGVNEGLTVGDARGDESAAEGDA